MNSSEARGLVTNQAGSVVLRELRVPGAQVVMGPDIGEAVIRDIRQEGLLAQSRTILGVQEAIAGEGEQSLDQSGDQVLVERDGEGEQSLSESGTNLSETSGSAMLIMSVVWANSKAERVRNLLVLQDTDTRGNRHRERHGSLPDPASQLGSHGGPYHQMPRHRVEPQLPAAWLGAPGGLAG